MAVIDVRMKAPSGAFVSLKGAPGNDGNDGGAIEVFEQPTEPATAQPGAIWFVTDA